MSRKSMMANMNSIEGARFLFPDMTLPLAAIQRGYIGAGKDPCALILFHDQTQGLSALAVKTG